jgi:hypothetical protein
VPLRGALAFVEQKAPALAGKDGAYSALSAPERGATFSAMLEAGGLLHRRSSG